MRTAVSPHPPVTLVGRDRELGVLREHLHAALAGQGSLVLIGGEAGIGKTALAETICREAEQQGALVLVGRCYDLTETPPYGPWVEVFDLLRQLDDITPLPTAFSQRGTVGAVVSQSALFQQVVDFLTALAGQRPLVLMLDDAHWMDVASLDLLRFLSRSLAPFPLLLLVTYRVDELTRRHPLSQLLPIIVREASATRIALHPLESADTEVLVRGRFTLVDADTTRLVAYLDARGEGNPFFIGELLQTLTEERVLRARDGGWALGGLARVQVPPLLRQVIDSRLARLGDDAQAWLAVGAVIGQEVPLAVWLTVVEQDESALWETVEQASAARLVDAQADGMGFRFVHALIREALYEGIPPLRRRALHRRVGEVLLALPTPDPDAVAYHFQRANDDRAVAWLITAGDRAQRAYAWTTATQRYESALTLLGEVGEARTRATLLYQVARLRRFHDPRQGVAYCEEAERLATAAGDPALIAAARFSRGHCRWYADNDFERALRETREGVDLLEALTPAEQARLGCPPNADGTPSITLCRGQVVMALQSKGYFAEAVALGESYSPGTPNPATLGELGRSHYGDWEQGRALAYAPLGRVEEAQEAFALARRAMRDGGHFATHGQACFNELRWVVIPFQSDQIERRHALAEEGEEAWRLASAGTTDPPRLAWMPVLLVEGGWEEARAVALHEVQGSMEYQRYWALWALGPLAHAQGEPDLAWPYIRAVLPDGSATAPGKTDFTEGLVVQRAAAALALETGDTEGACAWLEAHDRWLTWSGAVLGRSEGAALWAKYWHALGNREEAHVHAQHALDQATAPRQPLALLAAHRLLGELATETEQFVVARTHLDAARALAEACAAPYERALTLLALADLAVATGMRDEGIAQLDAAFALCEPLGAKPALARADAVRARLDVGTASPVAYPAGLSPREIEVLRLLAEGKTNRDIAEALFLSEHTVRVHVRSILTKTQTENRTAAAAFARLHGLA